jgi:hypothetical protein
MTCVVFKPQWRKIVKVDCTDTMACTHDSS